MNIFDEFIVGNVEEIDWCFELSHFNQRLSDNNISLKYVKQVIMEEDFIRYEQEADKSYGVYYPAPPTKDYDEIKLVFSCDKNTISLVTIMPITGKFKNKKYNDLKKKRDKAHSSVNRRF
ncbi:MAG: DUF4258 domain-containing protein [Methanobrevibacter sp.]|uniref:DUF4258 domain-containing protein n=1 Tax=Methanobrevibacter sp. TaxID=66852 RepID=UPI0026DF8D7C|nr:DUF4258 domain-containing protein [Methanobrevibacter sp.]MDO5848344.1 DUF4258 domain-containing protein [Methanobrevibacter sp.]